MVGRAISLKNNWPFPHLDLNTNVEEIKKDNRARGKGSRGPYRMTEPEVYIPDVIKLPDGRVFQTKDLVKKQTGTRNYNLLNSREPVVKAVKKPTTRIFESPTGHKTKYSPEERIWQCSAHVKEIEKKYNMKPKTARATQAYARKLMNYNQTETETGIIRDYTNVPRA